SLEAILVNIHRTNLRFQGRWRNAELGCGTEGSGNPASRFGQGSPNYFPFLHRRSSEERLWRRLEFEGFTREPTLVHREILFFVDNHGSLDYILKLADVS